MVNRWAEQNLPKLDGRLFTVFDKENGWWEIWLKMKPHLPTPKDSDQAESYQFEFCNGDYHKLMNCIMPDGTIADPGPWLAEVLAHWDTRRDGRKNLEKWWKEGRDRKRKEKERERGDYHEQIKYYDRAIKRGLDDHFGGGDVLVEPEKNPMRLVRAKASG